MTRKSLILLVIAVVLAATGILVIAQDSNTDTTFPYGHGWMHRGNDADLGPGMMHGNGHMMGGFGMMWNDEEPMMYTVAQALGLTPEDFFVELRDGKTLTEIADAQGVEIQTVYDVMLTEAEDHMSQAVEAGYVTQEQADEHLTWMHNNIATMPMFSVSGFGTGMMEHGGMRWNG